MAARSDENWWLGESYAASGRIYGSPRVYLDLREAGEQNGKTECLDSLAVEDVTLAVERVLARNDALVAST